MSKIIPPPGDPTIICEKVYLNEINIGQIYPIRILHVILGEEVTYRAINYKDKSLCRDFSSIEEAREYLIAINTPNSIDFITRD